MVPCLPGLITNCMSTVLKPGGLRAKGFGSIEAFRPHLAALRGTDNVLIRASRAA